LSAIDMLIPHLNSIIKRDCSFYGGIIKAVKKLT
jgi:hypothetical protein